jgi:hypothetical protein
VLDFAHGYQKENQETVNENEEECVPEVNREAVNTEAGSSQEIGKAQSGSEKDRSHEEDCG